MAIHRQIQRGASSGQLERANADLSSLGAGLPKRAPLLPPPSAHSSGAGSSGEKFSRAGSDEARNLRTTTTSSDEARNLSGEKWRAGSDEGGESESEAECAPTPAPGQLPGTLPGSVLASRQEASGEAQDPDSSRDSSPARVHSRQEERQQLEALASRQDPDSSRDSSSARVESASIADLSRDRRHLEEMLLEGNSDDTPARGHSASLSLSPLASRHVAENTTNNNSSSKQSPQQQQLPRTSNTSNIEHPEAGDVSRTAPRAVRSSGPSAWARVEGEGGSSPKLGAPAL